MKYFVTKDEYESEEGERYVGYGISVIDNDKVVKSVSNISCSVKLVKKLCDICNKLKLDNEQLNDVVEDFLADI